jgi:hypothetical protein
MWGGKFLRPVTPLLPENTADIGLHLGLPGDDWSSNIEELPFLWLAIESLFLFEKAKFELWRDLLLP